MLLSIMLQRGVFCEYSNIYPPIYIHMKTNRSWWLVSVCAVCGVGSFDMKNAVSNTKVNATGIWLGF